MKTSRPFSTISYNTDKFLTLKLDDLVKREIISFYAWIEHYPEEDEKKVHKHLYIVPDGQIDTNAVRKVLEEIDVKDPAAGLLKCMDVHPSKFDDWYLYGIHDTAYLASKGQSRKYHYRESDVKSSDAESLHEKVCTIDFSKYRKTQEFVDSVISGIDFYDLVRRGQIPAPQFMQWKHLYDFIKYEQAHRNDRQTHTPRGEYEVDPETGEVLYGLPPKEPEQENGQVQTPVLDSPADN